MAGIGGPSDWVGGGGMVCLCSAVPGVSPVHAWCYMDLSVRSLLRPVSLRRHSRHFLCHWREAAPPLVMGIENKNMGIPLASISAAKVISLKSLHVPRVLFADSGLPVVQQNVRSGLPPPATGASKARGAEPGKMRTYGLLKAPLLVFDAPPIEGCCRTHR